LNKLSRFGGFVDQPLFGLDRCERSEAWVGLRSLFFPRRFILSAGLRQRRRDLTDPEIKIDSKSNSTRAQRLATNAYSEIAYFQRRTGQ
jgi:hypothetical protein